MALFACGYEERCRYLPSVLGKEVASSVAIVRYDFPIGLEEERGNVKFFHEYLEEAKVFSGRQATVDVCKLIYETIQVLARSKKEARLLVDYSSMRRDTYAAILKLCACMSNRLTILLYLSYSAGVYGSSMNSWGGFGRWLGSKDRAGIRVGLA